MALLDGEGEVVLETSGVFSVGVQGGGEDQASGVFEGVGGKRKLEEVGASDGVPMFLVCVG